MKGLKTVTRKLLAVGVAAMMMVGMTACGNKGEDATDNGGSAVPDDSKDFKIVLKLSHVFSPDEQLTKSMDLVADRINEKTNGAVEIQTYPQAQLATYKDGLEQVVRGADFISVEDPSYLGDYVPDFQALVGPMLYTSFDEYEQMIETDLVKDMIAKAEEKGIKILALDYIFGFRSLITNKVIEKPEDLKGIKLRTPGSQLFIDTINSMGATATSLPFAETISAVQQGVVDGLEGSEFTNLGTKCYEVAKNVALTRHFLGTCGVYISNEVWNKIPAEYQKIVEEEFAYGAQEMIEIMNKSYDDTVEQLKSFGVQFNEVDNAAFSEATKGVYDSMKGVTPGIYDKLQEELSKMRK